MTLEQDKHEDVRARLIYDVMAELGLAGKAATVAEKIKRLELGLPVEDECILLLSWLGKCKLIHKLDQLAFRKVRSRSSARNYSRVSQARVRLLLSNLTLRFDLECLIQVDSNCFMPLFHSTASADHIPVRLLATHPGCPRPLAAATKTPAWF